jgi:hypothetical protein
VLVPQLVRTIPWQTCVKTNCVLFGGTPATQHGNEEGSWEVPAGCCNMHCGSSSSAMCIHVLCALEQLLLARGRIECCHRKIALKCATKDGVASLPCCAHESTTFFEGVLHGSKKHN